MTEVNNSVSFSIPIRIYWEDTDAGGVVYHANYLKFLERARTEWVRSIGYSQQQLRECENTVLVVRAMKIEFKKPARLDDELIVSTQVMEQKRASLTLIQLITRDNEELFSAEVKIACLYAEQFKPKALPDWLTTHLNK